MYPTQVEDWPNMGFRTVKEGFFTQIFWCTYDFCTAHLLCILADSAITYRLNPIQLKLSALKNKQELYGES